MNIPVFYNEDLRVLASLAIDLKTEHQFFKVVRVVQRKENYWSFDCRFSHAEDELDTCYESLHIDSGNYNEPDTYQMAWTSMKNGKFKQMPITSPLVVVHYFEKMCKKNALALQ